MSFFFAPDRKLEASQPSDRPALEGADGPFMPSGEVQKLIGDYNDVAKASFAQMTEISQRAAQGGPSSSPSGQDSRNIASGSSSYRTADTPASASMPGSSSTSMTTLPLSPKSTSATPASEVDGGIGNGNGNGKAREISPTSTSNNNMFFHPPHFDADAAIGRGGSTSDMLNAAATAVGNPSLAGFEGAGLRVFTVGTLQPREDVDEWVNSSPGPSNNNDGSKSKSLTPTGNEGRGVRGSSASNGSEDKSNGLSVPFLEDLPAGMPKVDTRTQVNGKSPTPLAGPSGSNDARATTPSDGGSNLLRVRRSTFVPGW